MISFNSLSKVTLLSGLTRQQLSTISNAVEIITYEAGEQIFAKGSAGKHFYMIKEGRVKLTEVGELNSKFVYQSLSVGEYFGERALITSETRVANAIAESKVKLMIRVRVRVNIITKGERGDKFYIIKSGTVSVSVNDQEVNTLEAGKYFGEMTLLGDGLRQ